MPNIINLFGTIGDVGLTAPDIKAQLAAFDDHTAELVVNIDSPGGSVFAGFAMFKAFEAYPGKKTAVIESAAFSIASYLPMAFDEIQIADNGYLMIHNPTVESGGDDEAHASQSKLLGDLKADMVRAYSARTGIAADEVLAMMKAETYLNAADAVSMGFADSVMGKPVASRVVDAHQNFLPYQVVASLCCDAQHGDTNQPTEQPMAEEKKPVAASVADIKAAVPKASAEFIVGCVEKGLPIAKVVAQAVEDLTAENETLRAQISEFEALAAKEEAAAVEHSQAEQNAASETAEAQAKAKANQPVANAGGSPKATASATSLWNQSMTKELEIARGNRQRAVMAVNRKNPGLRQQMLAERNA